MVGDTLKIKAVPRSSFGASRPFGANALEPLGVTELDMPGTSERVWQAIREARGPV
jgi:hypothetical protein